MPEYEFLRKNADSFYRNAKQLLEQGEYNLAAFNLEQAMQLMLKYLLASRLGEFPRTHSLRRLFREIKDLCPRLWEFYEDNASVVGNVESAYIASRYYPVDFQEVEVREMLSAYEEFLEVLRGCLGNP
ncbi:MAG: DNA-binding protein [Thermoproteota archaeon]|nr:MAG: DNA-binding protein [Candidatus Korarchaeota archaeon]